MKHAPSEKYSIAWFKLSECIAKGERERALGLYRLLAHSLDNKALAKQLEADILLLFGDTAAHEKYQEAALLFAAQHKWHEATALYEHLVSLGRTSVEIYASLINWYDKLARTEKVGSYRAKLVHQLSRLDAAERARVCEQIGAILDSNQMIALYLSVIGYCKGEGLGEQTVEFWITQSLNYVVKSGSSVQLQQYLAHLESLDLGLYQLAKQSIERAS